MFTFPSVSIVDFEQVNVSWETLKGLSICVKRNCKWYMRWPYLEKFHFICSDGQCRNPSFWKYCNLTYLQIMMMFTNVFLLFSHVTLLYVTQGWNWQKKQVKSRQNPETEILLFENYSLSLSALSSKNNRKYSKQY